jgi:hypothetical protein
MLRHFHSLTADTSISSRNCNSTTTKYSQCQPSTSTGPIYHMFNNLSQEEALRGKHVHVACGITYLTICRWWHVRKYCSLSNKKYRPTWNQNRVWRFLFEVSQTYFVSHDEPFCHGTESYVILNTWKVAKPYKFKSTDAPTKIQLAIECINRSETCRRYLSLPCAICFVEHFQAFED